MILSCPVNITALTSGTINGFEGSIRHADELSITVMPASANFGAHSSEVPPPAENNATEGLASIALAMLITLYFFPLNSTSFPTDLSEATGNNSVTGKFLSANTCNILEPTNPVAPTTATFILLYFIFFIARRRPSDNTVKSFCFAVGRGPSDRKTKAFRLEGLSIMVTYITLEPSFR